jgi:hypothetical protein
LPAGDLERLAVTPGWRSVLRDVSNRDGRGA